MVTEQLPNPPSVDIPELRHATITPIMGRNVGWATFEELDAVAVDPKAMPELRSDFRTRVVTTVDGEKAVDVRMLEFG